jgi:hypothetical protein
VILAGIYEVVLMYCLFGVGGGSSGVVRLRLTHEIHSPTPKDLD